MTGPRIGSLFSGAGGLDMAVESVFGGHTVWHSEIDPAASKVLAHRWPGVPNLGDITKVDWSDIEPVDILCGGWPCQPFSLAGKRKGLDDDRALWPYVARAIRAIRPGYVVLENVPTVLTAGEFHRVATDLASLGYGFRWTCARASDVGAAHRRERLFIVASECFGFENKRDGEVAATYYGDDDLQLLPTPRASDRFGAGIHGHGGMDLKTAAITFHSGGTTGALDRVKRTVDNHPDIIYNGWQRYGAAIKRWERVTRSAPAPYQINRTGNPQLTADFAEWLMGWPAGWVTDPAIGIGRGNQLRVTGNGVVPQQAEVVLRYLLEQEKSAVACHAATALQGNG